MELEIKNGDYCPAQGGGFAEVDGYMETVQRIMMRLQAHRGGFYPLPDFGSRLHTLLGMKSGDRHSAARAFVHEALAGEPARILRLECRDEGSDSLVIDLFLDISGHREQLSIKV